MTDALTVLISGFEGCRLKAYDDATGQDILTGDTIQGKPTIGIGRCLSTNGITLAEADYLLQNDLQNVKEGVLRELPWIYTLDETRQNVLYCMAFQLGVGGLMEFTAMLKCLEAQNYPRAAEAMLDSLWAKQTPSRAQKLADLIQST